MTQGRRRLGAHGESLAARWYEQRGYQVVDRNWRGTNGELDLVLRHGSVVVFCEVKTRSSTAFGTPAEAVTPAKQARIRRLAVEWLRAHGGHGGSADLRFDVVGVMGNDVEVIEAAF